MNQRLPVWRHINIGTIDHQLSASIVDFELLTIVESQILRASEIQRWYMQEPCQLLRSDKVTVELFRQKYEENKTIHYCPVKVD